MNEGKYFYMVVTQDEYELPLIVSERVSDIAAYVGKTENAVFSSLAHYYAGHNKTCLYRRVEKEEHE